MIPWMSDESLNPLRLGQVQKGEFARFLYHIQPLSMPSLFSKFFSPSLVSALDLCRGSLVKGENLIHKMQFGAYGPNTLVGDTFV